MRSLRGRLFVAILGTVLLAVGASLALGVVLTRNAVRDTIRSDVERQADTFATQVPRFRVPSAGTGGRGLVPAPGATGAPPTAGARPPGVAAPPAVGAGPPPGEQPLRVLTPAAAARVLPDGAAEELRRTGAADGVAEIDGRNSIYAARRAQRAASRSSPVPTSSRATTSVATCRRC